MVVSEDDESWDEEEGGFADVSQVLTSIISWKGRSWF